MDSVGLVGFFGLCGSLVLTTGLRVYWIDQYLWQQWGRGIVVMQWRIMLRSLDGVEPRRLCEVFYFDGKANTVLWWHKHFGIFGLVSFVYGISRCNFNQLLNVCYYIVIIKRNVIVLLRLQFGGGDFMLRKRFR